MAPSNLGSNASAGQGFRHCTDRRTIIISEHMRDDPSGQKGQSKESEDVMYAAESDDGPFDQHLLTNYYDIVENGSADIDDWPNVADDGVHIFFGARSFNTLLERNKKDHGNMSGKNMFN